jgi:two-component sensor histidine kinase
MPPAVLPQQTQLRLRALAAALEGRGICVLHQTRDHRFDLAEHLPKPWVAPSVLSKVEAEFMEESVAGVFRAAVDRCLEQQELQTLELELPDEGGPRTYQARLAPDEDGVLTILSDVTDRRSREAALASLLREVSHRSKNLLAIVQSVAMQTAHHSGDIQDFLKKFRGRLHALSSTQDLVTESDWQGTRLHALIASQLARVGHSSSRNIQITGENPILGPNASLHLGLAIHELAANAVAHGGLAEGKGGNVWVNAGFSTGQDEVPSLVVDWLEASPSAPKEPREPRFGTLVLERIVPLSVSGTATFAIENGKVSYRLTIPAGQFEA